MTNFGDAETTPQRKKGCLLATTPGAFCHCLLVSRRGHDRHYSDLVTAIARLALISCISESSSSGWMRTMLVWVTPTVTKWHEAQTQCAVSHPHPVYPVLGRSHSRCHSHSVTQAYHLTRLAGVVTHRH
jgi:hypothetical protein